MAGLTPLVDEFAEDIWYEPDVPRGEPRSAVEPDADTRDEPRTADPAAVLRTP